MSSSKCKCVSHCKTEQTKRLSNIDTMIYWPPLTQPTRWGQPVQPRRGRFPQQLPCQPGHLGKNRWQSANHLCSFTLPVDVGISHMGSYLSSRPCRWVFPSPEPACSLAHFSEGFGYTLALFHTPWKETDNEHVKKGSKWHSFWSSSSGIKAYFKPVVGHCEVEQEVSRIIFGCSLYEFYERKGIHTIGQFRDFVAGTWKKTMW